MIFVILQEKLIGGALLFLLGNRPPAVQHRREFLRALRPEKQPVHGVVLDSLEGDIRPDDRRSARQGIDDLHLHTSSFLKRQLYNT